MLFLLLLLGIFLGLYFFVLHTREKKDLKKIDKFKGKYKQIYAKLESTDDLAWRKKYYELIVFKWDYLKKHFGSTIIIYIVLQVLAIWTGICDFSSRESAQYSIDNYTWIMVLLQVLSPILGCCYVILHSNKLNNSLKEGKRICKKQF